jgi:hypothetical protein
MKLIWWRKYRKFGTKHVLALHNDSVHVIEEKDGKVFIAGKEFDKGEAVKHLRNMASALQFIAKQLEV